MEYRIYLVNTRNRPRRQSWLIIRASPEQKAAIRANALLWANVVGVPERHAMSEYVFAATLNPQAVVTTLRKEEKKSRPQDGTQRPATD